ncbi:hypothetical protein BC937DRAFT_93095 [Endogone sp. FLAS-F59071]|nr:hypothetical protein BC937DRAFT_93095 [Endogone sp. FLAS-F59071]|eukprot:RUS14965.1 hypothetical protein BC937DRAFT_93095 [Endogone sp. FLAS-F59071]
MDNNYASNLNNPRDRLHDQVANQDTFPQQSHPLDPNSAGDQLQTSSTDNTFLQDQDFRQNVGTDFRSSNLQQPYRESQPKDAGWGNERGQGQVATDRDLGGSRIGDNTGYPKNFGQTDDLTKQYGQQQQQQFATGNQTQEQQRALSKDYGVSQGQRPYDESFQNTTNTSSGLPQDIGGFQQTPEQRQALSNEYNIQVPNSTGSGFQQGQTSFEQQQQPYSSQQGQTSFEQQQQQQPYQDVNPRSSMPGAFDLEANAGSRAQPGQDTTSSEPLSATMPSDIGYDQRQSNLPATGTFNDGVRNADASSGLMDRYEEGGRFGDNRDVDRAVQAGGLGSGVLQDRNIAQEGLNARSGNSEWNNNIESGPRVSADKGLGLTSPPPLPSRDNDFGGYQNVAQEVDHQRNQQSDAVDDGLSSDLSDLTLRSDDPNRHASPLNQVQDTSSGYPAGVSKLSGNDTGFDANTTDTSGLNRFEDTNDHTYRNAQAFSQPSLSDRTGALEEVEPLSQSAPVTTTYGTGKLDTQPGYTSTDNTNPQNLETDYTQTDNQNLDTDTNLDEEKPSYTEGLGKKLKGTIKYGLGKILGDPYLRAEGEQQKREGQQTLDDHRRFVDQKEGHDTEQTAATDPASRREE